MDNVLNQEISNSNQNLSNFQSKLMKLIPYIFCFFIFSFIGWLLETVFCFCALGRFIKRGFLYSAICPIYRYWSLNFNCIFR